MIVAFGCVFALTSCHSATLAEWITRVDYLPQCGQTTTANRDDLNSKSSFVVKKSRTMKRKKRSKCSVWEFCYANKIFGTYGFEIRALGQKLVKFCAHTHKHTHTHTHTTAAKLVVRISEVVDALSDNTVDPNLGCSGCGLEWPDLTEVPEYKVLYRYTRQRRLRHWQCLRIRIAPYIFPSPHHATVCGCVEDMGPGGER